MPNYSGDEGCQGKDPGRFTRTRFFPDRPPNASVKAYISDGGEKYFYKLSGVRD